MAFVAIANFAQQNNELGYAIKFMRIMILTLTALLGVWGFALGLLLTVVFVACNRTVGDMHGYLYPLIPWNGQAMRRLLFRTRKQDFDDRRVSAAESLPRTLFLRLFPKTRFFMREPLQK